jgi:hypothetical protein
VGINHTFKDAWWASQEKGKVQVEVHFLTEAAIQQAGIGVVLAVFNEHNNK